MTIFFDLLIIIFLFFIFALSHSYFASLNFKNFIGKRFPKSLPYFRLTYNIVSLITFYLIFLISPQPEITIYDLHSPWDLIILIPQFLSLFGLIWTLRYIDIKEFLGINQILRAQKGRYNFESLDEESVLRIEGPYKFTRHPLYLFTILFLLFRPTMSLFYLLFLVFVVLYFYIGSSIEEKKIENKFGAEYLNYKLKVGKIFPRIKTFFS